MKRRLNVTPSVSQAQEVHKDCDPSNKFDNSVTGEYVSIIERIGIRHKTIKEKTTHSHLLMTINRNRPARKQHKA